MTDIIQGGPSLPIITSIKPFQIIKMEDLSDDENPEQRHKNVLNAIDAAMEHRGDSVDYLDLTTQEVNFIKNYIQVHGLVENLTFEELRFHILIKIRQILISRREAGLPVPEEI